MGQSIIKITFTEFLPAGAQLGFDVNNDGGSFGIPSSYSLVFNWRQLRTSSYQVTAGFPESSSPGRQSSLNFIAAFNADTGGIYTVTRTSSNQVIIAINNLISTTTFSVGGILAPYINHPSLQFEIINDTAELFQIQSFSFLPSLENPCEKVRISLQTSQTAVKMISPISIEGNTQNPLVIEYFRGQYFNIELENSLGLRTGITIDTPGILSLAPEFFQIQIANSPNGATVTFMLQMPDSTGAVFSLDGTSFQASNVFSGILEGDHTVYVKDDFGCVKTKDFHIDSLGINSPFFYVSKSMPLRFANRVEFGDAANYKNDENTLSFETLALRKFCEVQQFQSADIVATQFFSNYQDITATAIEENGNETALPISKKTSNIGIKNSRDARRYGLGNGKTGIYFVQGNLYDYDSGAVIGNYALNGALPEWAVVGNYFSIGLAWYQIEEIVYDETKNADIIVFSNNYSGPESNIIVKAIYNRFEYEVYEFAIDMVNFLNKNFRVRIDNTDPNFPPIEHLSELINVKIRQEDTLEIKYRNTTNTDVVYSTGINNILRIPYTVINGLLEEENETYKTDTSAKLLKSELYEVDEFVFEPLTKEMWRKLCQALSHEIVFIDAVGYTKNADFESEGPLGESNLYVLNAKMIKNGNVYNSSGLVDSGFGASPIEIPGFVEYENGFVRY